MKLFECRACSSTLFKVHKNRIFKICLHCGGYSGEGHPYKIHETIKMIWEQEESKPEDLRFFDITIIDEGFGVVPQRQSIHGWFNPTTKLVNQIG
jgi:hypothetical protein